MEYRDIKSNNSSHFSLIKDELGTLYEVSKVLNRSVDLEQTIAEVLKLLHDKGQLLNGMVALLDEEMRELKVFAVHHRDGFIPPQSIRYRQGEGLVGTILHSPESKIINRLGDDPRFLDRLNLYDKELPFIGVPIIIDEDERAGVFVAQPPQDNAFLHEQAKFLEMVSDLVGQSVGLSRNIHGEKKLLEDERDQLRREIKVEHGFGGIVGHSALMRQVYEQVRQVAKWNTTVLIRGESGTGKELVANSIHYNSSRANSNFIKLNSAALPDNLLESELFGHEKGAFTGAATQRKGRFELADGGTLFLDEIGEISPNFQAKLLRVLQEQEFERVGGHKTIKVDVRVIAATNRDLESEVEQGNFREDLYYRLNVMPIKIPALRERIEDVPELAKYLVNKISKVQGRTLNIDDIASKNLLNYEWPGNVRELENFLERAAITSRDGVIDIETIAMIGMDFNLLSKETQQSTPAIDIHNPALSERERVVAALEQAGWVQAKAARILGMTPRQIAYRIQTLNIRVKQI